MISTRSASRALAVLGLASLVLGVAADRAAAGPWNRRVVVVNPTYVVQPSPVVVSSAPVVMPTTTVVRTVTTTPVVTQTVYTPTQTFYSAPVRTVYSAPVLVQPAPVQYVVPRTFYVYP